MPKILPVPQWTPIKRELIEGNISLETITEDGWDGALGPKTFPSAEELAVNRNFQVATK